MSQHLLSLCLNLSCLYSHEAGPSPNPLNSKRNFQETAAGSRPSPVGSLRRTTYVTNVSGRGYSKRGSSPGAAGPSWSGFGDLELLSWLLLSWHTSIERCCKMAAATYVRWTRPSARGRHRNACSRFAALGTAGRTRVCGCI